MHLTITTLSIIQFPICGMEKIINANTSIFIVSVPAETPNSKQSKANDHIRVDRIPKTTDEMLFKNRAIHITRTDMTHTGSNSVFSKNLMIFIHLPLVVLLSKHLEDNKHRWHDPRRGFLLSLHPLPLSWPACFSSSRLTANRFPFCGHKRHAVSV